MITKETAMKIYHCYTEIENSNGLIKDMADTLKKQEETIDPSWYNAFGERVGLEMGVPTSSNSKRIFKVNPSMALKVLEGHIVEQTDKLENLMLKASLELKNL